MPSWKKVILSGSDAALNSLNTTSITASVVSASQFTGSLFGTSSWAIRAVSSSFFSGNNIISSNGTITNLTTTNLNWGLTPNTLAWYRELDGDISYTENIYVYIDENDILNPLYSLRIGNSEPENGGPITYGSHILKDETELFTNARAIPEGAPFKLLGFSPGPFVTLDSDDNIKYKAYWSEQLIPGEVYAGSLSVSSANLYGVNVLGLTQIINNGSYMTQPASPGLLMGEGGYYIFDSASMVFDPISGSLLSPMESASVKFTLGSDSSSLSLLVGKRDLREVLFISRSGNEPRVGIGLTTPQNTLTVSGSLRAFTSITSSTLNTTQISTTGITASRILANSDVILSGSVLELPNLTTGTSGNYTKLLIVDSVGRVRTLDTGSVPYIEVGSGVVPVEKTLVMFTGSTGDVANAIGVSFSTVTGWTFGNTNGILSDLYTDRFYSPSILGNNITGSIISASGGITGSDLRIKGFPSVSASLASLASGVGTLQQVTDAGNTTTNPISSSFNGVGFFGTASWAINVVNGGGGGGGGSDSAFLNQSTAATTWSFAHNLGTQYPVITVYDTTGLVIIPQEIDGEDTNNLKIYFPTSQSGYATAVGGTSALTYYSQSLTTASISLNTITFTKGDSSTFDITVNTGSSTISSSFALTASYVNPLRQDVIITGSTYITGGFEALGNRGSKIQLGTYNVGYDIAPSSTLYITGSGLIISGNMPDQNHHNFLKIGNVELVDVNTAFTSNEFLIHNVNTLRITSGADGGNITTNNQLLKIGGGDFYVYRAGSKNSSGLIRSTGNQTEIEDTNLILGATDLYFNPINLHISIPDTNEISTLNGTDYLIGFATNPAPSAQLAQKIKANKFIWATGSNQIISSSLIITGSTFVSGGVSTQYIDFDINAVPAFQTGRVNWVDDTKTLAIDTELSGFQIEVGHQNVIRVRNETGTTISRSRVVYLSGSSGNRPLIYTASFELDPTSAGTVGLVAADIGTSNNGYVISNGLIRDINTTAFTAGAVLYLSSSGQLSTTAPVAPLHAVRLGKVITSAVAGIIHVDVDNGYEIGELHDVVDNTTNTTYGSLLVKSGSVWKDSYQLTGSYGLTGSLSATSFTGSLQGTASWALNVVGGGGGGGVTINNNVDNYIVTATGTANTLNGESELLYSGSTLINRGRTYFGSGSVPTNVSHTFRGYNQGDSSYFSVLDFDGNKVFNINGDAVSGSLYIDLGDTLGVGSSTTIALDDNVGSINLTGKTVTVGDVNNNGYLQYTDLDTKFSFKGSVEASLGGFTGSLQGTSSWATNTLTASNITPAITNNTDNRVLTATGAGSINGEANLTFDGSLLDVIGDIQFNENRIRTSSTTVGQPGKGADLAYDWGNFTTAPTAGRVVYFASGSGGFGWRDALADATGSSIGPLGVATNAASQDEILLRGAVRVSGSLSGLAAGQIVYLNNTISGSVTGTAPSTTGHVVRILGYVISPTDNTMYFNPDFSYITRT